MRTFLVAAVTALALTGCSGGGESSSKPSATLAPSAPEADNALALATVLKAEDAPEPYLPINAVQPNAPTILQTQDPACTDVRVQYFPESAPVASAVGPTFVRDPDTPFTHYLTTSVEIYSTPAEAERVISALRNERTAFCLRRLLEPLLIAATNNTLLRPTTALKPLTAVNSSTEAGVRVSGSAFFQRQAVTPTVDFIASREDRAVVYGTFVRIDGSTAADFERQIIRQLRTRVTQQG